MTTESPVRRPLTRQGEVHHSIGWYLRQLSHLMSTLSDEDLNRLIPLLTERQYAAKQLLFSAGDPADRLYLVLKGRVKIFQVAENGKEIILDVVARGGVVGDMAVIEDRGRLVCAQAIEPTTVATISWTDFSRLMNQSPRLAASMLELMARRLLSLQRTFTNLVSKPVSARLADFLLERREGAVSRPGLTHQELAQTIGTSRETVTALLSRFAALGAIAPVPDGYRIIDLTLLDDIADGALTVSPRHPVNRQAGTMVAG